MPDTSVPAGILSSITATITLQNVFPSSNTERLKATTLTSPPPPFSDNEESMDERDNVLDADTDLPDEDGDSEDLFDDNLLQEYVRELHC